jgi:hypothetical protein
MQIGNKLGVPKSTASAIYRHALKNAREKREQMALEIEKEQERVARVQTLAKPTDSDFLARIDAELESIMQGAEEASEGDGGAEIDLLELISRDCLDPNARCGRPPALTLEERDNLIATVKRNFTTRRMRLLEEKQG